MTAAQGGDAGPADAREPNVAFVDLHCHTSASFDSLADPAKVVRLAAARGITHLVITDHDRIDGALRARDAAPDGLVVIVGEEVKSRSGDLICAFLERPIPPGLPGAETIALVRDQGGMVGIPHPFDRYRNSAGKGEGEAALEALAPLVDWVEAFNARVVFREGNERAAAFAARTGLPGVAVSDAHSTLEVGVAMTRLAGDPSTPAGLRLALQGVRLVPGRATYFARGATPIAKLVNRLRGNRRVMPVGPPEDPR